MTGFFPVPAALPRGWVPASPAEASWVRDPTVLARWMAEDGAPPRSRSAPWPVGEATFALRNLGLPVTRSADWEDSLSDRPRHTAGCLSRAGIAPADMVALVRSAGMSTVEDLTLCASTVRDVLGAVSRRWPQMPVRDTVGWYLCLGDGNREHGHPIEAWGDPIEAWDRAGLLCDGWRYLTAGLTVGEAVAGLVDGSVDRDRAGVLAGLRGAALPA